MERLKIGSKFKQNFPNSQNLVFEIKEIDYMNDHCKALVFDPKTGHSWEEDWDDLHLVHFALQNGDYILL